MKPEDASAFLARQKEIAESHENTRQRCLENGFVRIPEDFLTLEEAAQLCKNSEGKCMEIRVSTGRYRTADDVRTTAKDRDLALKATSGAQGANPAAAGGAAGAADDGKAGGTGSLAGAAAHEENRFAKYVSVSQQSIQKDYFSPRLMIDFSGLRIVGAGAGGFADPYPDRVGPSKPYPGSFGMLEQGGGSGKTVIVGGIEVQKE